MTVTKADFEKALSDNPTIKQRELAVLLDLSPNMVWRRLKKYGLCTARGTAQKKLNGDKSLPRIRLIATREQIEDKLAEFPGISQKNLGAQFDMSRRSMREHLIVYGLKTDQKSKQDPNRIHALFAAGHDTPAKMSEALGVHEDTARKWMVQCKFWSGNTERGDIRQIYPLCLACDDPVDPNDDVWGGLGDVHFTCARGVWRRPLGMPNLKSPWINRTVSWVGHIRNRRRRLTGLVVDVENLVAFVERGKKTHKVHTALLTEVFDD